MMMNMFSIFDPYMSFFPYNWISTGIMLILIPQGYWLFYSRYYYFLKILLMYLWNEYSIILINKFNMNNLLLMISLFIYIMVNNFMGLFPYIFTSTSHLVLTMSFSLTLWMGMMLFGWGMNTQFMFMHLVPSGTPFMLMFFMVLIETLSNIIRPMTLAVRLTANMIAGHLLLTLLSMFIPNNLSYLVVLLMQMLLLLLEMGVSLIQSYVFVILMILYLKETN